MVVGYLWGIRTEVVAGQAFPLATGLQPWDCNPSRKLRRFESPITAGPHERAPNPRFRRSRGPFQHMVAGEGGSKRLSTAVRPALGQRRGVLGSAAPAHRTRQPNTATNRAVNNSVSVVFRAPGRAGEGDMTRLAGTRVHQSICSRVERCDHEREKVC